MTGNNGCIVVFWLSIDQINYQRIGSKKLDREWYSASNDRVDRPLWSTYLLLHPITLVLCLFSLSLFSLL